MTNHVDRFYAAVSALVGDGHIKQRLIRAYADNLVHIEDDDLPVAMKESFLDLRRKMHKFAPSNGEGPICASVRKMSAREASKCAASIVDLYGELVQEGDLSGSIALQAESDEAVPPFLVKSLS